MAAAEGWRWIWRLLMQGGLSLLLLALADVGWQWWTHYQSLKMTKQELRDESKGSEGNPEVKARVRRIQRDMTRRRMLAVKTATVVVTNPTHSPSPSNTSAARCGAARVAKGQDLLAARIRKSPANTACPSSRTTARAGPLQGRRRGDVIPGDLFGAVAELLAYLVRIRQLML
jgi:flagellar biosynthetic protein FlhB